MFEVKLLVDDNKLNKVLWALDGLLVDTPQILPVRIAPKAAATNGLADVETPRSVKPRVFRGKGKSKGRPLASKRGMFGIPKLAFTDTVPGRCAVLWKEQGLTMVSTADMSSTLRDIGSNPGSYSYVKIYLEKNGVLGIQQPSDGKYPIKYATLNLLIEQSNEEKAEKAKGSE